MCPDPDAEQVRAPHVVDPDVDLHDPRQRAEVRPHEWQLLVAIAVGGVLGAEARYGLDEAVPHRVGRFPWATLVINISGCLLIGVLMVLVLQVLRPRRMLRPFLGTGVLGGYTTFSTFGVDAAQLLRADRVATAIGYVIASLVGCLGAVALGSAGTRRLAAVRRAAGQPAPAPR